MTYNGQHCRRFRDRDVYAANTTVLQGILDVDGILTTQNNVSILWNKISGPGAVTFDSPVSLNPEVRFSALGNYELKVTVSNGFIEKSDTLRINVMANPRFAAALFNNSFNPSIQ